MKKYFKNIIEIVFGMAVSRTVKCLSKYFENECIKNLAWDIFIQWRDGNTSAYQTYVKLRKLYM